MILFKWIPQNISHWITSIILIVMSPVINVYLYIKLLRMVLTCPSIQYPVKITSILGIWATKCIIMKMDVEMMDENFRIM